MRRMKGRHLVLGVVLVALLGEAACTSTVIVPIRVPVASKIDLRRYQTIAVLSFIDQDERLPPETLRELAAALRRRLSQVEGLSVVGEGLTEEQMASEEIDAEAYADPANITNWAGMLDASAVATGVVRFYTLMEPRRRTIERYSYRLGRYVTDIETVFVRVYHLAIELTIYDGCTGEVLMRRRYTPRMERQQGVVSAVVEEVVGSKDVLLDLAQRPIRDFVRQLAPHYEYEERYLAR